MQLKIAMKNYKYIGVTFIILIFGIWAVPKIVDRFSGNNTPMAVIGKVPSYQLTNQDGKLISDEDFKGKVYVVEFFFTTCPTICPEMNENMTKIQDEFFGNPNFGIASFSINPEYDTPEILAAYAKKHGISHTNWHLLTGERDAIFELANQGFNLYAAYNPKVKGNFEHSGYFALINKQGEIVSRLDEYGNPKGYYDGLDPKDLNMLKSDIKKLL